MGVLVFVIHSRDDPQEGDCLAIWQTVHKHGAIMLDHTCCYKKHHAPPHRCVNCGRETPENDRTDIHNPDGSTALQSPTAYPEAEAEAP